MLVAENENCSQLRCVKLIVTQRHNGKISFCKQIISIDMTSLAFDWGKKPRLLLKSSA